MDNEIDRKIDVTAILFHWFRIDNKHMTEPWLAQALMNRHTGKTTTLLIKKLAWELSIAWKLNLLIKKLAWEPSIAWKLNLLIKKLAWEPSIAWKLNLLIKKLAWEPSIAWNLDLLFKASLLNLKFSNPLFNLVLCFSCLEVERPLLNY